jgi:3-oxoacyl-[acyl-carrier protein] reductase
VGNDVDLTGTVALVTGAGRGIGRAIALDFARRGAQVVACARTASQLEETSRDADSGSPIIVESLDVTDGSAVQALVARTEREIGPITLLINNAGICDALGFFPEVPVSSWWRDIEVNLGGSVNCAHAVIPGMIAAGGGRIVNMISGAAFSRQPLWSAYCTSKAALHAFTESIANDLADTGIKVFSLDPGLVHTALLDRAVDTGIPEIQGMFASALEAGYDIPVERPVEVAVALASGAADGLSGRFFDSNEDIDAVLARAEEILRANLYVTMATR